MIQQQPQQQQVCGVAMTFVGSVLLGLAIVAFVAGVATEIPALIGLGITLGIFAVAIMVSGCVVRNRRQRMIAATPRIQVATVHTQPTAAAGYAPGVGVVIASDAVGPYPRQPGGAVAVQPVPVVAHPVVAYPAAAASAPAAIATAGGAATAAPAAADDGYAKQEMHVYPGQGGQQPATQSSAAPYPDSELPSYDAATR
eukprot:scpid60478/ scgid16829/ 